MTTLDLNDRAADAGARVLDPSALDHLIHILRSQGRTVIGPRIGSGRGAAETGDTGETGAVIVNGVIERAEELPWGWTDEQGPGRYRLRRSPRRQAFGFAAPAESWKRHLHPPRRLLMTAHRDDGELRIERPEPDHDLAGLAFLGVRSCDLAGLRRLDQALHAPPGPSPRHHPPGATSVLDEVFIVAVSCGHPSSSCFCVSTDTGPQPGPGYDLALTELDDERGHEFLAEVGTDRARAVLVELGGRPVDATDRSRVEAVAARARAAMVRSVDPDDPQMAARHPEHPRWTDVAERCLACANCTMACPTCFCSATEDSTDVAGRTATRHRVWDSCFGASFSELNGIPVRSSTAHRYRQWLLHKLVTWHDQFDTSGCVGCGRCITWCPVGIDLTEEVAALSQPPRPERSR